MLLQYVAKYHYIFAPFSFRLSKMRFFLNLELYARDCSRTWGTDWPSATVQPPTAVNSKYCSSWKQRVKGKKSAILLVIFCT